MKILLAATLVAAATLSGCGDDSLARSTTTPEPSPVTVTTTLTPSPEAVPTVTITAEVTVTATATIASAPSTLTGTSSDFTNAYIGHARASGMPARQLDDLVRATLTDGALELLTSMEPGWGGWDCAWEPRDLSGQPVHFTRVLYQDGTVFRLCN